MKQPCSQHFSKLIDEATTTHFIPGDTPEKSEARRLATLQTLKLRIGELELRESKWGSAYWSVRYLARELKSISPGISQYSDVWTVVGCVLSAISELAAARIELKKAAGETVTKTCLDCVNLDVDRMPTPGHVCYECDGKLVAVKADGSNFEGRSCGNCANKLIYSCSLRTHESQRVFATKLDYIDPCVELSAWRKRG